ncbi:MAG TPA: glutamate--tRNA ligase [Tepidisphaeraceae bacterium]|jgi:glutamyl-tRNA synthetase|nr:glutamate--tRNA ligase [Tepidisphaeraceae bacterium]
MSQPAVVTRFAPSPTGYLHVGGARTALFNWLLAKHSGGQFLLRIEDTDLARSTDDATRQLLEDLKWLGLNWDNAELVYQSKRLDVYNKLIDGLIEKGHAYEAWETTEELTAMRDQAARAKRPFLYRRMTYTADQLAKFKDDGRKPVIRFVMPVKEYRFKDEGLGKEVVQSQYESQDFVIRKTDGMPTYHFGVVVDDAEMGITHILRGQEHLKNTFNHIALQEALGYERPTYAHLSVLLNPEDGSKLSKRDRDKRIRKRATDWMRSTKRSLTDLAAATGLGEARLKEWIDVDTTQLSLEEQPNVMRVVGLKEADLPEIMVHDFRKNGYVPEVLNNFLALLGWSPGGDLEQMSIDQMVEKFGLDRLISANSKFNRDKLKSFSTDYFAKASPAQLIAHLRDYLKVNPNSPLNNATDEQLAKVLSMNAGFHILSEVDEKSAFLFTADDAIVYSPDAVEKVLKKNEQQGLTALRELRDVLVGAADWTSHDALEAVVKSFCEAKALGLGKVAQPLRVALSGTAVSPPIFDCLAFLGKDKTLARIDRCVAQVG